MSSISSETGAIPPSGMSASHAAQLPKMKFNGSDRFLRELRKRVDAYFESTGRPRRDAPQMYFKTATILLWFAAAYALLLFVAAMTWRAERRVATVTNQVVHDYAAIAVWQYSRRASMALHDQWSYRTLRAQRHGKSTALMGRRLRCLSTSSEP